MEKNRSSNTWTLFNSDNISLEFLDSIRGFYLTNIVFTESPHNSVQFNFAAQIGDDIGTVIRFLGVKYININAKNEFVNLKVSRRVFNERDMILVVDLNGKFSVLAYSLKIANNVEFSMIPEIGYLDVTEKINDIMFDAN